MRRSAMDLRDGVKARRCLEDLLARDLEAAVFPEKRAGKAFARERPDRLPFDFWAVPETVERLEAHLGVRTEAEILALLRADLRVVLPDYSGPEPERRADGTYFTIWGSHRKLVHNAFSAYEEYASFPLAGAETRAEVESWPKWPKTSYWDWSGLPNKIDAALKPLPYYLRCDIGGIFESAWGLYGLERFLVDLLVKPEVPCAIMDCYTDLFIENVRNLASHADGRIPMVYTYDDVATQTTLLLSPELWRQHILPRHGRLNAEIKKQGFLLLYHSCGAVFPMLEPFVSELGIDALNPLQPRAAGMDFREIKRRFGSRIAFHGGIDIQETLPAGTPEDVEREVRERMAVLGPGGYVCAPAHYIQADVPVENILALYTAERTGPGTP